MSRSRGRSWSTSAFAARRFRRRCPPTQTRSSRIGLSAHLMRMTVEALPLASGDQRFPRLGRQTLDQVGGGDKIVDEVDGLACPHRHRHYRQVGSLGCFAVRGPCVLILIELSFAYDTAWTSRMGGSRIWGSTTRRCTVGPERSQPTNSSTRVSPDSTRGASFRSRRPDSRRSCVEIRS